MAYRWKFQPDPDDDASGHIYINFDRTGRGELDVEDSEGHVQVLGHISDAGTSDDDTHGHGLADAIAPAAEKGTVRRPRVLRFVPIEEGSTEGHRRTFR